MIKSNCFTKEWIDSKRKELGRVDPILLEKTIYAFELLGQLCQRGIDLVFKGGTSLLLLLPQFNRLSIDIDILCDEPQEKLQKAFDKIITNSPFDRWEENPRKPTGVPKKHFRFYFKSVIDNRENFILLDILKEINTFPKVQVLQIKHQIFDVEEEVTVKLPNLNGITGDKLTAFAPTTIGIHYDEDRSMQIIKQLFDLGVLAEHVTDLGEIENSYDAFLAAENSYRQSNFAKSQVLKDTIEACYLICQLGLRRALTNEKTKILQSGVQKVGSHLININYNIDDARYSASKTALIASSIAYGSSLPIPLPLPLNEEKIYEIRDLQLDGKYQILNRLKAVSPESFYCWYLISQMENEQEK